MARTEDSIGLYYFAVQVSVSLTVLAGDPSYLSENFRDCRLHQCHLVIVVYLREFNFYQIIYGHPRL